MHVCSTVRLCTRWTGIWSRVLPRVPCLVYFRALVLVGYHQFFPVIFRQFYPVIYHLIYHPIYQALYRVLLRVTCQVRYQRICHRISLLIDQASFLALDPVYHQVMCLLINHPILHLSHRLIYHLIDQACHQVLYPAHYLPHHLAINHRAHRALNQRQHQPVLQLLDLALRLLIHLRIHHL